MSKEIDIAALRKAAQEAYLQRDWAAQPMQYDKGVVGGDDDWIVHEVGSGCVACSVEKGDAQYIAAANPAVILALLDRLEQAEKDAKELAIDAALGRTAMKFVDRAGDVHPGIDDAETICAEFHAAMAKTLAAAMQGEGA